MDYLCHCRAGLLPEPDPLSASRSTGCLVFQLGFPSSPDTVCLTRVYSDARGLLAVLLLWEQNSHKHPSCTPLGGCSAPIPRHRALSPAFLCVDGFYTSTSCFCASTRLPTSFNYPNDINIPVRGKYRERNQRIISPLASKCTVWF